MTDFWKSSGYHLLKRDGAGALVLTDDFLRAYYLRPEMRPVAESCAAERALHETLMAAPRTPVPTERIAEIADPDARENYAVLLAFRDRLLAAETLEAAYLSLFREGAARVPPLFVDQLVHVILRGILDGADDPLRVRAGECLFRAQKITIRDGAIMAADSETVEMLAAAGGATGPAALVPEGEARRTVELEVLGEANAETYWSRDERHDLVLDLSFARPGLDALCRVLEAWVDHFLGVEVAIQPVQKIADEHWVWHVGLDAEASALLNDLYEGAEVGEERLARLLSLFRLEFADAAAMRAEVAGRPVYLAMAMTPDNLLRLKPQNLLVNLPLARGM